MEGAQAAKTVRDRGELEVIIDRIESGNQQLSNIQNRLRVIRNNLYGNRPGDEQNKNIAAGKLGRPETLIPVHNGCVAQLRDKLEQAQGLRESINEMLAEIEAFV